MSDTDLSLLGRSEHRLPASPDEAALETFPNRTPGRNYTIHLSAPDFASLCPVTGQPGAVPARSCSPAWTPTALRRVTTSP